MFSAVPTDLCWGFLSHLNLPYQSFLLSVRWAPDEKKERKHFLKFLAKWPVASGKTAVFYKKYISVGVSIFIIEAKMGHTGPRVCRFSFQPKTAAGYFTDWHSINRRGKK